MRKKGFEIDNRCECKLMNEKGGIEKERVSEKVHEMQQE